MRGGVKTITVIESPCIYTSLFAHRDGVGSNPGAEDWFQADQWCQAHNGFLVQIDSAEENNAIMEATGRKNGYHIWLGLTKFSGNWSLSSVGQHDQKPDFLKPIHPITYELYGNCASMDVHVGSWSERPCGLSMVNDYVRGQSMRVCEKSAVKTKRNEGMKPFHNHFNPKLYNLDQSCK